jgi:hypothetical protein
MEPDETARKKAEKPSKDDRWWTVNGDCCDEQQPLAMLSPPGPNPAPVPITPQTFTAQSPKVRRVPLLGLILGGVPIML